MLAKYWDTTTDKPEEDCEFDFILTSELRFGWGMHLVTEELQIPQYELSEIEILKYDERITSGEIGNFSIRCNE